MGALALLVIGAAAFSYLRSGSVSQPKPPVQLPNPPFVQKPGDVVTFDFISPSVGWAAEATVSPSNDSGPFWIFKTADRARHWQKQLSGKTAFISATIGSLQMLDRNNGFVVAGDPLKLYHTVDGGARWSILAVPSQDALQVTFSDLRDGWVLAHSRATPASYLGTHLYATSDAGSSWKRLPDPPSDLSSIAFRGAVEGWAGARGPGSPGIYTSQDAGDTWKKHELPTPPGYLPDNLYSTYLQLLPAVGAAVTISYNTANYKLTSFDKGGSWAYTTPPMPAPTGTDLSYGYQDSSHWWAVGGGVLYKSSDGGQSWTRITDTMPAGLNLLQILDSRNAWAQFNDPTGVGLTDTSDGGLHWTSANVPMAS
jgi:photosystem II stability/assembly factor-like uncharacterized protein